MDEYPMYEDGELVVYRVTSGYLTMDIDCTADLIGFAVDACCKALVYERTADDEQAARELVTVERRDAVQYPSEYVAV